MLKFAAGLYRQRASFAFHGYARRDPMSLLHLRPGRDNPYAVYEELRRRGVMVPTRMGNWVTTSHEVCRAVLRDRQMFVRPPGAEDRQGFDLSFLDKDPPDHTRLRRLAQPAFSPRQMEAARPRVTAVVDQLLDRVSGSFDLVTALASPLPITVITDLMGVPDADADRFAAIGAVFGSALDGVRSPRHAARLVAAGRSLRILFEELFELRRAAPGDDVISRIVAASASGDAIRPPEMVPLCDLLLVAGFETTVNLIGNAVNALLDHPAQWAALCADPAGLAGAAIEETLRWDPPVQRTLRFAHEQQIIAGAVVRPGQAVNTLIGAANRDPAVFSAPEKFDIYRPNSADHLSFSAGIHYCVGRPLALLEATVAVERLATRFPGLRRAGRVRRRASGIIRGPVSLPVAVSRARSGARP